MAIIYILFLGTIKVLFGRFYIMIGKWSLISILLFSDLIYFCRIYIINGILGCFLLYLSVSLIFICIELLYIFIGILKILDILVGLCY